MTIEQFERILDYLITVVLPPNVSADPPVTEAQVLEALEAQCDYLRGKIIHNTIGEPPDDRTLHE